jgi:hypothetical protein
LLEQLASVGQAVERGNLLARILPPLVGRAVDVRAPHDGLVLEAGMRAGVRTGAPLYLLGKIAPGTLARQQKGRHPRERAPEAPASALLPPPLEEHAHPLRVGWVETVSLPALGVDRLRAKIDTGARTSALHVTRMKTVGTTEGLHHRPILELTLPGGPRRSSAPLVVRVLVREYVQVKDTSGRSERRPVIETTLRLGTLERRIRVTLTNRGDMLFPMLIGRTALGPGVVVDPGRRMLLNTDPHSRAGGPTTSSSSTA